MQWSALRRITASRLAARIAASLLCVFGAGASFAQAPVPESAAPATLTLDDAIARAVEAAPLLRASAEGVRAADGAYRQAGVRPNPEILIEAENFGGSGAFNGFGGGEYTYSLGQRIERGGKRRARLGVAGAERKVAAFSQSATRLDIIFAAQAAFIDAAYADAFLEVARARATVADESQSTIARRVASARDPQGAADSAAAAAAEARADLARAEREAELERRQVALLTGLGDQDIAIAAPWFALPPALYDGAADIDQRSPDLAILKSEEERAEAAARLERAQGKQDPTLSVGVRHLNETDDAAIVASVSIPLGLFDRNKGAIARAEAERRQAQWRTEAAALQLSRDIVSARSQRDNATAEAAALSREVRPRAEAALAAARGGYARGAFTYLEVLTAQRTLADIRVRELDALRRAHFATAEFDRLTARLAEPLAAEEPLQ